MGTYHSMFRDLKKMLLKFDEHEFDVFFDEAIKSKVIDIKKEIEESEQDYLSKKKELEEKEFSDEDQRNYEYDNLEDISLNTDRLILQLISINEMRIIHLYKSFELEIINLIKIAYGEEDTYEFHKWNYLNNYIKSKNITPANLLGYIETNELRNVCNHIKHEGKELENLVKKITEFKDLKYFTYQSLESFNERVKPKVKEYLKKITTEFYNEIYVFDDNRLTKISNDFKMRMDENTQKKFIKELEK